METVVVAFEGEKNGRRLKELLESSGTAACLLCRSADQVKRLVRQQRLTAVVCGYKFPDGTAEELAGELPGFCTVLLLAPRGLLELVPERPGLLRLPPPQAGGSCSPRWRSCFGWARRPEPSCRPGGAVRSARWWSGPRSG